MPLLVDLLRRPQQPPMPDLPLHLQNLLVSPKLQLLLTHQIPHLQLRHPNLQLQHQILRRWLEYAVSGLSLHMCDVFGWREL